MVFVVIIRMRRARSVALVGTAAGKRSRKTVGELLREALELADDNLRGSGRVARS